MRTSEARGQASVSLGMRTPATAASEALPESKNFGDPQAADPLAHLTQCHVGGLPFPEWLKIATPQMKAAMCRQFTDEGQEEWQRLNRLHAHQDSMRLPLGNIATEPIEKAILERGDFIEDGQNDPMMAPDPMRAVIDEHREPGFNYRFSSDKANGLLGKRGYEIVKDSNGNPVKMADLTLGKIPTRIAQARQRSAEKQSRDIVKSQADQYAESVARLKSNANDLGLRVLEPGEMAGDFVNTETGRVVNIGG